MRPIPVLFAIVSIASCFAQTKEIRRNLPLPLTGHLVIDTYKGEIHVSTWDQPQVELIARIEPDGTTSEAMRLANDTDVRIDSTSDSLHLKSDYPRQHLNDVPLPFVRYTIRMPRTADLRIKDYKSEIEVRGLNAPLDLNTYKGDAKVLNQGGPIRMNSYKGHATFELTQLSGHNSFETYKGVFDIAVPSGAHFDVISDGGRHSNIRSSFPFTIPAGTYSRGTRFQAHVNPGGTANNGSADLVLKSYRGEMNLH